MNPSALPGMLRSGLWVGIGLLLLVLLLWAAARVWRDVCRLREEAALAQARAQSVGAVLDALADSPKLSQWLALGLPPAQGQALEDRQSPQTLGTSVVSALLSAPALKLADWGARELAHLVAPGAWVR